MLIYILAMYVLAGLGVNLGYHRLLTHRGLGVPLWLMRVLVFIGLPAGTPVQWVGTHRFHHAHADDSQDPHSPSQRGFWYAHTGWYFESSSTSRAIAYALLGPLRLLLDGWMRPRTNQQFNYLAQDVAVDPFCRALGGRSVYGAAMALHFIAVVGTPLCFWGAAGLVLSWGTYAFLYNLGDAVDSICHWGNPSLLGQQSLARNHPFLGVLLLGEGWHANHHHDPRCARHGWTRAQFDWTWQVIRALRSVGLARNVHDRISHVGKG